MMFVTHTQQQKTPWKRHLAQLSLCIGLAAGFSSVHAQSPNLNPPSLHANAPHVYVVKKGDTLWDISGKFLKHPWQWPTIWASNKHIKNPHWIYPGDKLLLCSLNGRPLIGKDEGDGCDGIIRRAGGDNSYTLTPQVRVESLGNTIPVVPLAQIQVWLEHSEVVSPTSLANLPYVLGMTEKRVLAAAGDRIYVRGNGVQNGVRYAIYRVGEPYTTKSEDGRSDVVIGIELSQIAEAAAISQKDDISTLALQKTYDKEVRKGDIVLPLPDVNLPTLFYPAPIAKSLEGGQIIRVLSSISSAAKHSVVAVNRGTLDGLQAGHVFSVNQQGEITVDPKTKERIQLPSEEIGHALVFKTFDHISYAYITDSSLPIRIGATISSPLPSDD